jgi:hypothetical protein
VSPGAKDRPPNDVQRTSSLYCGRAGGFRERGRAGRRGRQDGFREHGGRSARAPADADVDGDGDPLTDSAAAVWAARDYKAYLYGTLKRAPATVNAALAAVSDLAIRRGLGKLAARRSPGSTGRPAARPRPSPAATTSTGNAAPKPPRPATGPWPR